jgi:hypothetical protein
MSRGDLSSRCATGSSSCLAAILSSSCLLTEPRSHCLVAPAGCCVASRRVAVSSSRRAAALSSYCPPLTAPPSCCLVMLAGCCVASCRDTVLSSRCAAHSRPFVVLSLRHPLVASSRRLVVASPLASPPPSHPLVVLPHSRPTVVLSLRRLLVASSLRRDWHWWHPRLRTPGGPRSRGGAPAGTERASGTMLSLAHGLAGWPPATPCTYPGVMSTELFVSRGSWYDIQHWPFISTLKDPPARLNCFATKQYHRTPPIHTTN